MSTAFGVPEDIDEVCSVLVAVAPPAHLDCEGPGWGCSATTLLAPLLSPAGRMLLPLIAPCPLLRPPLSSAAAASCCC